MGLLDVIGSWLRGIASNNASHVFAPMNTSICQSMQSEGLNFTITGERVMMRIIHNHVCEACYFTIANILTY